MSDINEKFARLRELYPEDIEALAAEQKRVSELLQAKEYYLMPQTQELVRLCRRDITMIRIRLAKERDMSEADRQALWSLVGAREWFLNMVAKDYDQELAQIDAQLEADLSE